jgi:hypothetical protein
MPAVINTPWEEIKALYIEGKPPGQIAKQYGILVASLCSKANRKGWINERKARNIVTASLDGDKTHIRQLAGLVTDEAANSLQRRGMASLEALARDAELTVQRISKRRPKTAVEEDIRERTLKNLVERVKVTAGLTDAGIGAMIAVNDMSSALDGQKLGPKQDDIDVEAISEIKPVNTGV